MRLPSTVGREWFLVGCALMSILTYKYYKSKYSINRYWINKWNNKLSKELLIVPKAKDATT
jgi:hypothetical protein